jgi:hypothetical protein
MNGDLASCPCVCIKEVRTGRTARQFESHHQEILKGSETVGITILLDTMFRRLDLSPSSDEGVGDTCWVGSLKKG